MAVSLDVPVKGPGHAESSVNTAGPSVAKASAHLPAVSKLPENCKVSGDTANDCAAKACVSAAIEGDEALCAAMASVQGGHTLSRSSDCPLGLETRIFFGAAKGSTSIAATLRAKWLDIADIIWQRQLVSITTISSNASAVILLIFHQNYSYYCYN